MITYLDLREYAKSVLNNQMANETVIRAGISRAYYSAFHVCQEAADQFTSSSAPAGGDMGRSHERVYKQLEEHVKDREHKERLAFLAAQARKIRAYRVKADYRLANYTGTTKDLIGCVSFLAALIKEYEALAANKDKLA